MLGARCGAPPRVFPQIAGGASERRGVTPKPGELAAAQSTDLFRIHTVWEFEDTTGEYDE